MLEERDAQLRSIAGEQRLQGGSQQAALAALDAAGLRSPALHAAPPSVSPHHHLRIRLLPFCPAEQIERLKDVPPPDFGSLRVRWFVLPAAVPQLRWMGQEERRCVHTILLLCRGGCLHCCPSAAYSNVGTPHYMLWLSLSLRKDWHQKQVDTVAASQPSCNTCFPCPCHLHHCRTGTRSRWTQRGGGRSRRHARGRRWRGGGWHRSGWLLLLLRPPVAVASVAGIDLHACCRADSGWICFVLAWDSFGLFCVACVGCSWGGIASQLPAEGPLMHFVCLSECCCLSAACRNTWTTTKCSTG